MARAHPRAPSSLSGPERRSGRHSRKSPDASDSSGDEFDDWRVAKPGPRVRRAANSSGGGKASATTWHCTLDGCSKFFMREADLRRHQRTSKQHNSKSYYCECGRSFTRLDATRRHCVSFGHDFPAALLLAQMEGGEEDAADPPPTPTGLALLVAAAETLSPSKHSETDVESEDDESSLLAMSSSQSSLAPPSSEASFASSAPLARSYSDSKIMPQRAQMLRQSYSYTDSSEWARSETPTRMPMPMPNEKTSPSWTDERATPRRAAIDIY